MALSAALWSTVHGKAQLIMLGHLPREAAEPALAALLVWVRETGSPGDPGRPTLGVI